MNLPNDHALQQKVMRLVEIVIKVLSQRRLITNQETMLLQGTCLASQDSLRLVPEIQDNQGLSRKSLTIDQRLNNGPEKIIKIKLEIL